MPAAAPPARLRLSVTPDPSRAGWLRHARSYLRDADPVLARLIDDRPDFDPREWIVPAAADGPVRRTAVPGHGPAAVRSRDPPDTGPYRGPVRRPSALARPNFWTSIPASSARPGFRGGRSVHCGSSPSACRTAAEPGHAEQPIRRRTDGRAHRESRDRPVDRAGCHHHRTAARRRRAARRPRAAQRHPSRLSARSPPSRSRRCSRSRTNGGPTAAWPPAISSLPPSNPSTRFDRSRKAPHERDQDDYLG